MKILIIGNGGREHALAWKLAQSNNIQTIFVAEGNGGTSLDVRIKNIKISDPYELAEFAIDQKIAFTVIGPEQYLEKGTSDIFLKKGLKIFGPTKAAAQLETSKSFSKDFMIRNNIPTAKFQTFSNFYEAKKYIEKNKLPIVIKADGLAAGKGVFIANTLKEAYAAAEQILSNKIFGIAGKKIIIEEFIEGEEISFIAMSDGKKILPLATSQDYKRLLDNDKGLNTGGMGAFSPASVVTPELHSIIMRRIMQPTIDGMSNESNPYFGFLYAGIILNKSGNPLTLEFNCRMGDPETQVILSRLKSDFVEVFEKIFAGSIGEIELEWDRRTSLGVVVASEEYPNKMIVEKNIKKIPEDDKHAIFFHAGTKLENNNLITCGGRVITVVGMGDNISIAQKKAYENVKKIYFDGMQFRSDIGNRYIKK